jgi:hypothetical protein
MIFFKLYYPDDPTGGGGGGEKPQPAKRLKALSPTERRDWNDMLDKMHEDGVAGSKDLDQTDKNVGAAYIEKHRKENPGTSVNTDMIARVQNDHQQLRTGESFAGMSPEQTRVLRKQLNPEYVNKPVPEGSSMGSALSRMYYPEFKKGDKNYGTDAEAYFKDFATPSKERDKSTDKPKEKDDTIPKPNYDDPKSRNEYLKNWAKKHGDLEGRGDTVLKVNEIPRTGTESIKSISIKAAKEYGLDPALLYSSAMEEGASGLFKNKDGTDTKHRKPGEFGYQDYYGDKDYPINGGQSFGFQTFAERFPELVKGGYLPKDFQKNFRGVDAAKKDEDETHDANNFKDVNSAMKAKAAMLKYSQDEAEKYAKEKGIELSPKAKEFFALATYNGGEGALHKLLKEYNDKGLLKDDKFLKENPHKGEKIPDNQDVYGHVNRRLKMASALKEEKQFDDE